MCMTVLKKLSYLLVKKTQEIYMLHLKTLVRAQEKTKKEINFIGLKRKIYVINMLTMIKMNGILSIINKEAKKMVKCTHEKYKGSRLSAQLGQFYSFEDKSDKSG